MCVCVCVCVCVTTQIQILKLPKCQKRYIIKEKVIEKIQKIYDYSKEKYKKKKKSTRTHKAISFKF